MNFGTYTRIKAEYFVMVKQELLSVLFPFCKVYASFHCHFLFLRFLHHVEGERVEAKVDDFCVVRLLFSQGDLTQSTLQPTTNQRGFLFPRILDFWGTRVHPYFIVNSVVRPCC